MKHELDNGYLFPFHWYLFAVFNFFSDWIQLISEWDTKVVGELTQKYNQKNRIFQIYLDFLQFKNFPILF